MTGEEELSRFCVALGLSYELTPDSEAEFMHYDGVARRHVIVGYVEMTNPRSRHKEKKVSVILPNNEHSVRIGNGRMGFSKAYDPSAMDARTRDEIAEEALGVILAGCRLKVSNTKTVDIPALSCIEELLLRLHASGDAV